jgi:hypothetical protein
VSNPAIAGKNSKRQKSNSKQIPSTKGGKSQSAFGAFFFGLEVSLVLVICFLLFHVGLNFFGPCHLSFVISRRRFPFRGSYKARNLSPATLCLLRRVLVGAAPLP